MKRDIVVGNPDYPLPIVPFIAGEPYMKWQTLLETILDMRRSQIVVQKSRRTRRNREGSLMPSRLGSVSVSDIPTSMMADC